MIKASIKETDAKSQSANRVADRFREIGDSFRQAADSGYPDDLNTAGQMIVESLRQQHKLLIFGNGGSAADAQHFCGELVVRFQVNRRPLPAISLCSDAAVMTACGNDFSYQDVFARQIEALGNPGDIAFGISTSGNSPNIVKAFRKALDLKMQNFLLTGPRRGEACDLATVVLAAPGSNTARIQELHLASYHIICEMLDAAFS